MGRLKNPFCIFTIIIVIFSFSCRIYLIQQGKRNIGRMNLNFTGTLHFDPFPTATVSSATALFSILLCLRPGGFTCQGKSSSRGRVTSIAGSCLPNELKNQHIVYCSMFLLVYSSTCCSVLITDDIISKPFL